MFGVGAVVWLGGICKCINKCKQHTTTTTAYAPAAPAGRSIAGGSGTWALHNQERGAWMDWLVAWSVHRVSG